MTASGRGARASLIGYQDDIEGFLSAVDIFVPPSLSEGLPLALLEAASVARPIVASDVGGVPEVFSHGVDALLVPPADASTLESAMASLAADSALRLALGMRACQRVERAWSVQQTASRYLDLLYPHRGPEAPAWR